MGINLFIKGAFPAEIIGINAAVTEDFEIETSLTCFDIAT